MQIIDLPIDEITPYKNNPRKNDRAIAAVAASIKEFGFKVPIVIDKDGVIVAGHTRYKAALQLGLKTVPAIRADDLTDEQVAAFRLADNKTAELAGWKFDKLQQELAEIEIDMTAFGFGSDEETEPEQPAAAPEGGAEIVTLACQFHEKQQELIEWALEQVAGEITETFGNTNEKGNEIYEVVRQWAEQRGLTE